VIVHCSRTALFIVVRSSSVTGYSLFAVHWFTFTWFPTVDVLHGSRLDGSCYLVGWITVVALFFFFFFVLRSTLFGLFVVTFLATGSTLRLD